MEQDLVPVDMLSPGEWGEVAEVCGKPDWIHRLAELGVHCGCKLRLLQAGSPCILQVGDARFSMRADSAMQIFVRPIVPTV